MPHSTSDLLKLAAVYTGMEIEDYLQIIEEKKLIICCFRIDVPKYDADHRESVLSFDQKAISAGNM